MDVLIDYPSDVFRQRIFQLDAILDIVVGENEPVVLKSGPPGLIKLVPSLMAAKLAKRTGATDKIAIAAASWAVTAQF